MWGRCFTTLGSGKGWASLLSQTCMKEAALVRTYGSLHAQLQNPTAGVLQDTLVQGFLSCPGAAAPWSTKPSQCMSTHPGPPFPCLSKKTVKNFWHLRTSSPARHYHPQTTLASHSPSCWSHVSCSSHLHRNFGLLAQDGLTPHLLSLQRLLQDLIRGRGWAGPGSSCLFSQHLGG